MSKNIFYLILALAITAVACNETNNVADNAEIKHKSDPIVETVTDSQNTVSPKETNNNEKPKAIKKPQDTVKINTDVAADYNLKVGQIISCDLFQHSSTGKRTKYSIDNKEVLLLKQEKYEDSNPSKPLSDGSSGNLKVVFEAKKAGTCILEIRKMYRGNLEKELKYNIIVE